MKIPFFSELEGANNILIAGAGGGFDVFCGLPLYFAAKSAGRESVPGDWLNAREPFTV
jgi:hypothetical protein